MDLDAIIGAAADEADEFLAGVKSMTEARPAIRDYLAENYPELSAADVQRVSAGLLAILEDEGFFGGGLAGDTWEDAEALGEE